MTYQQVSSPSNQEAVMTALRDFAVAEGWTLDNFTAANPGVTLGVMSLSRGNVFVSFRWEGVETEPVKSIAMYQALGYSATFDDEPWNQVDDSGNGTNGTNLSTHRRIASIGSGPFLNLHLFASDDDDISGNSAPHIYCVLEYAAGKFRHFGFGNLDKFGDWTGGEWVAGHIWSTSGTRESDPVSSSHSVLLDGVATNVAQGISDNETATLHVESLPGEDVSSKWGQVWDDNDPANDRAGNPRVNIIGGCRRNLYTSVMGRFVPSALTGFLPLMPMPIFYRRDPGGVNARVYLLGYMPNIRMVQARNFNAGDEITIGANTWKIFPVVAKTNAGGDVEESENMGIAYLKVA